MNKLILFLGLFLSSISLFSQIKTEGIIDAVSESGLYKIILDHQLKSYAQKDLRDIRILDSQKRQVPYFITESKAEIQSSNFNAAAIISTSKIIDTSSTYIFKNPKASINTVVLHIANYQGVKRYSILGSDNQKDWFGVSENKALKSLTNDTKTSIYKLIGFPLCDYKYLKIKFNDRQSLPLNLLAIGTHKQKISAPVFNEISTKSIRFETLEKVQKTKIYISFQHPEHIDKLNFNITAPKHYKRNFSIYAPYIRTINGKEEKYLRQISSFTINSNTTNDFLLYNFFGKELIIEIENEDNPELAINKIRCSQKASYLIADLQKGEEYTITNGDPTLKKPKYDISYFKNEVTEELPILKINTIIYTNTPKDTVTETAYWQQPWFMWLCIGITGILILLIVPSLIKDLKGER